jgi:hypothetical protein
MNKYNTQLMTLVARNVFEGVVVPPADLSLSASSRDQVFNLSEAGQFTFSSPVNAGRNIFLSRLGLFSNMADGLVFNLASARPSIILTASTMRESLTLSGGATFTQGSKVVTGAGSAYNVEIAAGNYLAFTTPGFLERVVRVAHVTGAGQFELYDYSLNTLPGVTLRKLTTGTPAISFTTNGLPVLNTLFSTECFMPIGVNAVNPAYTYYTVLTGRVEFPGTATFSTKSIDTAFANTPVFFDLVAEVGY